MAQPKQTSRTWDTFATLCAELADLENIGALLDWDEEAMIPPHGLTLMPERGTDARTQQRATLEGLSHGVLTAPRVGTLLDRLEKRASEHPDEFDVVKRGELRELRRSYDQAVKLPTELVQNLARATARGYQVWREARAEDRWSLFEPALERIVALTREKANLLSGGKRPYDALLDLFEPGMTEAKLTPMFEELRQALVPLLATICKQPEPSEASVCQPFDVGQQWDFIGEVLAAIGFQFDAGRLDQAPHPFATRIGHGDVRLTDRADPDDLRVILFGGIHEGGHGMYDQGLPADLDRTSVGKGVSMGVHESQSRLWENFIGRSTPFWRYFLPWATAAFPQQLTNTSVETFVRAVNVVRPSLIRTEADEVTYNLHIIIRYELERGLIDGTIPVSELPARWNALYQQYLGITPPNAREGVLQDVHWASGMFGYFPSYTLGNVYAAQIWDAIRRDCSDVEQSISEGKLEPVRDWLREHIWQYGAIYPPIELIERATGEAPNPKYLIAYLRAKFGALYGLQLATGGTPLAR